MLYNLLSASIMTAIIHFGTIINFCLSATKYLCSEFLEKDLSIISALSALSLLFIIINWIILQVIRIKMQTNEKQEKKAPFSQLPLTNNNINHEANISTLD
jgi:hypothetical protein